MNQQLEYRTQSMLDGSITEIEFQHLEDELLANPEARQTYYHYVSLHQGLEYRLSRSAHSAGSHAIQGLAESRLKRQRTRARRLAIFSAAALIMIMLVSMKFFFIQPKAPQTPLGFEPSPGTLFTLSHSRENENMQGLHLDIESRLQISQGTVELTFSSGVRAIVQGPADITLHANDQLYMDKGTGWFHVPEQAQGFTVLTRELRIIDLGTQFGVVSNPLIDDEVHVFQGKVEVHALHGVKKRTTLTTDRAALVRPYGRFHNKEPQPDLFLTKLPQTLPYLHLSFDDHSQLIKHNSLRSATHVNCQHHDSENQPSAPNLTEGKFGNAISLDGIHNFLETDWSGVLGNAPRSVSFWIKMPQLRETDATAHSQSIIAWGHQQKGGLDNRTINSKWTIHLAPKANRHPMLNISFGGFWYYSPDTILDDDNWHHLAVTYTGNYDTKGNPVTALYVDGNQRPIKPATHEPTHRDADNQVVINTMERSPVVIGAALSRSADQNVDTNRLLKAEIDELYIIEGSISEDTVQSLMHNNQLKRP